MLCPRAPGHWPDYSLREVWGGLESYGEQKEGGSNTSSPSKILYPFNHYLFQGWESLQTSLKPRNKRELASHEARPFIFMYRDLSNGPVTDVVTVHILKLS